VVDAAGAHLSIRSSPGASAMELTPVTLPGGLGAHKWADRTLINELSTVASTPLFCDLDGTVLEAGYAAVLIVTGGAVLAPPLDGRLLASVSRGPALDAAGRAGRRTVIRPFTLEEARAADGIVLTSSLRGPHPGVLAGGPPASASQRFCDALA
jgi:para-aminobenzoate synthetase/4-amino-4-deoxychorismate lyase